MSNVVSASGISFNIPYSISIAGVNMSKQNRTSFIRNALQKGMDVNLIPSFNCVLYDHHVLTFPHAPFSDSIYHYFGGRLLYRNKGCGTLNLASQTSVESQFS